MRAVFCALVAPAVYNRTRLPSDMPVTPLPNMSVVLFVGDVVNAGRLDNSSFFVVNIITDNATLLPPVPPALAQPSISPVSPFDVLPAPPVVTITPSNVTDAVRYTLYSSAVASPCGMRCPPVNASSTLYTGPFQVPAGMVYVCARSFSLDGRISAEVSSFAQESAA